MPDFVFMAMAIGLAMLVWDCIEVGRNDAANLVNAVFGARVLRRRVAVLIAGTAVVLGASFSESVIETARKGIFDPKVLTIETAIAIYVSVYFVDTVLLYGFSGFGMPVSTTACLVFELVGASFFLAGPDNVKWSKVGSVVEAIIASIAISLLASFMVMRVFRGAIRDKAKDRETVLLHGPWIAGAIFTWLTWFMVFKGLKGVALVKMLKAGTFDVHGEWLVLMVLWGLYTLVVHLVLVLTHQRGYKYLFAVTAVVGMICMAFAFGQNDLANAASPGLASYELYKHGGEPTDLAKLATEIPIDIWKLAGCGILMASGMFTTYAQRVTRAEVNTGSQFDQVALYAPNWCRRLARLFLGWRKPQRALAPEVGLSEEGKKIHYDTLRASVITGVSASVIAFASGRGLPVSTTYVAFAAVLGTGLADRVFARGDADLKLGRAIWVISCWFIAPVIAIVATGCVALLVSKLAVGGLVLCIVLNLGVRTLFRHRADAHEKRYHSTTGNTRAPQPAAPQGAESPHCPEPPTDPSPPAASDDATQSPSN
ncbi:MAG: inorganic phosphate transporter [Pirellulales bacterium]|nr:inorganic phosphate transporter [Pirellulales bacterium]